MSDEPQLPPDPYSTGLGPEWDLLADAAHIWQTLHEMDDAGDVLTAIKALDEATLRRMVFERIATTRLRFEIRDGGIEWNPLPDEPPRERRRWPFRRAR